MKTYTVTNGDADTVIDSDRLRRAAEAARDQMERERNAALQREATALAQLEEMRRIAAIAIIISVLVISVGIVLLWLNLSTPAAASPSLRTTTSASSSRTYELSEARPAATAAYALSGSHAKMRRARLLLGISVVRNSQSAKV